MQGPRKIELTVSHLGAFVNLDRLLLLCIECQRDDVCATPSAMSSKRGRWQASFASFTKAITLLRIAGVVSSYAVSVMVLGVGTEIV